MKFIELTKEQQSKVFTKIVKEYMQNGEEFADAIRLAETHIEDIDGYYNGRGGFILEDYSPDEDGTDIRVEW